MHKAETAAHFAAARQIPRLFAGKIRSSRPRYRFTIAIATNMHFLLRYGLPVLLLHAALAGFGQRVEINADPAIEQLMRTWTAQNRSNPRIEGWRVQIASSTDRQRIESTRTQFLALYPGVPADWAHERPYYKLRVGAFRTRQEAMAFLMQIRHSYPDAYPTRDLNIHPRDFIR